MTDQLLKNIPPKNPTNDNFDALLEADMKDYEAEIDKIMAMPDGTIADEDVDEPVPPISDPIPQAEIPPVPMPDFPTIVNPEPTPTPPPVEPAITTNILEPQPTVQTPNLGVSTPDTSPPTFDEPVPKSQY